MNLNNIRKTSSKQKISNIIFLFTIFLAILVYFVIIPSINSIHEYKNKIINEKINSEKKLLAQKNVIELRKKLNQIEPDAEQLKNVFINKNEELEFITTLENIANKNNVSQKLNLSALYSENTSSKNSKKKATSTESKDNTTQEASITISASGNFKNINNYLSEIKSLEYYINIQSLELTRGNSINTTEDSTANNQIIDLNITAKTYWK